MSEKDGKYQEVIFYFEKESLKAFDKLVETLHMKNRGELIQTAIAYFTKIKEMEIIDG